MGRSPRPQAGPWAPVDNRCHDRPGNVAASASARCLPELVVNVWLHRIATTWDMS